MFESVAALPIAVCLAIHLRTLVAADPPDPLKKVGLSKDMGISKAAYSTPTYDGRAGRITVLGESTQVFPGAAPQFTLDGRGIVYSDTKTNEPMSLYYRDFEDGKTTKIKVNTPNGASPSLSPDGTRLAFRVAQGGTGRCDIYVRRSDPYSFEDEVVCEELTFAGENYHPRWSPDGTQILFLSDRNLNTQVFVMDEDGGNQTSLTEDYFDAFDPAWSPDGEFIAYAIQNPKDVKDRFKCQLYVMKRDGTEKRKISPDTANDCLPVWLPDGESIAFRRLDLRDKKGTLWIVKPDGTDERQLSRNKAFIMDFDLLK